MFNMIQNLQQNNNKIYNNKIYNRKISSVPVKTRTLNHSSIQNTMVASRGTKVARFSLTGVSNAKIYGGGGCGCGK